MFIINFMFYLAIIKTIIYIRRPPDHRITELYKFLLEIQVFWSHSDLSGGSTNLTTMNKVFLLFFGVVFLICLSGKNIFSND